MELSCEKQLSYIKAEFGPVIKITRDRSFFGFNRKFWRRFRHHIPMMRKPGYRVHLTVFKRIINKTFNNATYISFEQDWKDKQGTWVTSYINLNLDEWSAFIRSLWQIDQLIGFSSAHPCYVCNDTRTNPIGRPTTKLSDEGYTGVVIANSVGMEPIRCEYCGEVENDSDCHCHQNNCRNCSWFNFCDGCGMYRFNDL